MRFDEYFDQRNSDLAQTLEAVKTNVKYNLNCIKIAIVEEFRPETMEVQCRIANKKLIRLNSDGSQVLEDYPLITARCHFFGWGDIGATYPITQGMEGFLLFNDRELESWFVNGGVNQLAYTRCHDLTDAIFICGIHSKPNVIDILLDCLHLYNKETEIQLQEEKIIANTTDIETTATNSIKETSKDKNIDLSNDLAIKANNLAIEANNVNITNTATNITGEVTITNNVVANSLHSTTSASGYFTTNDGKIVTVVDGIVTTISQQG